MTMTETELCLVIKGRINTLIEHHNKLLNALKITNDEHPEYLKQPIDLGTIQEKLGNVPNELKAVETYIKSATSIYLTTMTQYENLHDSYPDYVNEKRFLYS